MESVSVDFLSCMEWITVDFLNCMERINLNLNPNPNPDPNQIDKLTTLSSMVKNKIDLEPNNSMQHCPPVK